MSGARTAVRTTRAPDDLNTSAKRAPSFVSWSQTSTSGAPSMVAFLACCAHHPAVGPYVTAAWMILRRRGSRKKSTKTSRNRMSYVWTKSHAHVTWLRRNVDQPWPSPGGREPRMYRWTVRLQTRTPSLSNSPRMRSAPQRGLRVAISRINAAREVGGRPDGREHRRQWARNPARCQRRMVARLDEQTCLTPSWRDACGESNGESLPRCPPDAARDFPLRHDELLSKKRVLRDELAVTTNEIGGESRNEPKEIDHVSR